MPYLCKKCGSPVPEGCVFCQQCGEPVATDGEKEPEPAVALVQANSVTLREKASVRGPFVSAAAPAAAPAASVSVSKKFPRKAVAAVALAVAVAAVALAGVYLARPKAFLSVAYIKSGELYDTGLSKIKPLQMTDKNSSGGNNSHSVNFLVRKSKDGRTLFYPDELDTSDSSYTLYCRDMTAKNVQAGTKIDSDVKEDYQINEAGTLVFYIKSDGSFYYSDKKDKTKIDSDVSKFYISADGGRVLYIKSDDSLYQRDMGAKKDKEKVSGDATLLGYAKDLSTYYYSKGNDLYRKAFDKDGESVASDMHAFVASFDDGSAYYTKGDSSSASLYDYVDDDMAASDASITEPQYSDYETQTPTTDFFGYTYNDTQFDEDGYEKACEAYSEKEQRNTLRSELKSDTVDVPDDTLYYYDGSSETSVAENYSELKTRSSAGAAVIYGVGSGAVPNKTKLSDITSASDFETKVEDELKSAEKTHVAVKANDIELDEQQADYFSFNPSGTAYDYLDQYSTDQSSGTLMEGKIEKDRSDSPTEVDDDVCAFAFPKKGDTLIYLKNMENDSGDLYVNKTKVDSDVSRYVVMLDNSSAVAYLTDYSEKAETGTLRLYNGKKSVKISDDVNSAQMEDSSHLVYIGNYDSGTGSGDLFCYDGSSKVKTVDTDVSAIMNPYPSLMD